MRGEVGWDGVSATEGRVGGSGRHTETERAEVTTPLQHEGGRWWSRQFAGHMHSNEERVQPGLSVMHCRHQPHVCLEQEAAVQ
jgi:hypothetical protein